jgi:hypothetical protein
MFERRDPDLDDAFTNCKGLLLPNGLLGMLTFCSLNNEAMLSMGALACTLDRRKARRWVKRGYSVDVLHIKPEAKRLRCILEFDHE